MSDIPADVLKAVIAAYTGRLDKQSAVTERPTEAELIEVAAACVLAERERCARIAEFWLSEKPVADTSEGIAAAIRKGAT